MLSTIKQQNSISIQAINEGIDKLIPKITEANDQHCMIFGGDLSNAIFWYYLGMVREDSTHLERAHGIIEHHINNLSTYVYGYKFGYGIPGFAWAAQFLTSNELIAPPAFLNDFDGLIQKSLKWNIEDKFYDLFTGYIGKGLYFIERFEESKADAHKVVLEQVIDGIESSSIYLEACDGRVWKDIYTSHYTDHRNGAPYYGLGLSHGIPSIIYFLSLCHNLGIQQEKTATLIRQACNWLLEQEIISENKFPDLVYPDGEIVQNHSLAWCYGTLSVTISIYAAGKVLQDDALLQKAKTSIIHCAKHFDFDNINIGYKGPADPFICHGLAGISHIFNQFGKVYDDEIIQQASNYWLLMLLNSLNSFPFEKRIKTGHNGLLEGPAGIGAVLLDRTTEGNFKWNKIFLTDIERF